MPAAVQRTTLIHKGVHGVGVLRDALPLGEAPFGG